MARSKRTIDHTEIKKWAEARGARPSHIKRTGSKEDPGLLRLNFPAFAEKNLENISWKEFFEKFEENKLAFLYQDKKSNGETSNFSRLVKRDEKESRPAPQKQTETRSKSDISSIMSENIVWCSPDSTLEEAALIMTECNCGELPVVESDENPKVVGVITDRDITCRSLGIGEDPLRMFVEDCMTKPAVSINENGTIDECIRLMEENKIRRVIVVDDNNYCRGIVALADIVQKFNKGEAIQLIQEISRPSDEPSQVQIQ